MSLQVWISETLTRELDPLALSVEDESDQHAGHGGWREGGETHFRIDVVSHTFLGKSRVERHRIVNACLAGAFAQGLHALAIKARAPGE
jgi:BolA protein